MIPTALRTLYSLFFRPNLLQVAALCWRENAGERQVLLVRSLDSNRWIVPKGWPMRGKTLAEAAAIEAWEEAGVKGTIAPEAIGSFQYEKQRGSGVKQSCDALVFDLHVTNLEAEFPEANLRKPRWFSAEEAAKRVREPELQALILMHLTKTA
ncbi:NUDIX hydrolase [Pseudorhodobacter sp. W20_MBD10_FR17]|uniref:NUDIX hydrolase n=1 Tax=Pseudorhodobacter sp. W20_MBD10_FR17 TaxID=3240266 RepID=UPI003F9C789A